MHKVLTRAEALAAGLSRHQLDRLAGAAARWQRVLPGVYVTYTGPLTVRDRCIAALKYAGAGAALAGRTAALLHGIRYVAQTEFVHVLVPATTRKSSRDWVRIQRTTRPLRRVRVNGLPAITVARATVDLALVLPTLRDVRAVVGDVLQRRLTTLADLRDEFVLAPQQGKKHLRQALEDAGAGTRSAPEGGLRDIFRRFRLPVPQFNARIMIAGYGEVVVDALWRKQRVVVEVDSREWHLSPADWERTMRRHNALQRAGYVVLHFPPSRIYGDPQGVAVEIRNVVGAPDRA